MTSQLTSVTINRLEPLLGSVARLIMDNDDISDGDIEILLISADIDPKAEIVAELRRWTELLQRAKKTSEKRTQQAVREALMQRGVQQANAQLAVSVVTAQKTNADIFNTSADRSDLVVNPNNLDFGALAPNKSATKVIEVQGEAGEIKADNPQILVVPKVFESGKTRIEVTIKPKSGATVLWGALRVISPSTIIEIPVVAQWRESSAPADMASPTPNSTSVPPSGHKSVASTSPGENPAPKPTSGQPSNAATSKSSNTQPFNTRSTKPATKRTGKPKSGRFWILFIVGCIALALAGVVVWERINPNEYEPITQEQTPYSTPIQGANTRSSTLSEELVIEPTSTKLPTKTPLPTNTPVVPTFTPTPDLSHFVVSGPAEQWLPDDGVWLPEFSLAQDDEYTNDEAAQSYADPDEALAKFEEFRRVGSHVLAYEATDFCNRNSGILYEEIQVIVFRQSEGISSFIDYLTQTGRSMPVRAQVDFGEDAWVEWFDYQSTCSPPQEMRAVDISFRRYNVFASALVAGVSGTIRDEELVELAKGLARATDHKLLEAAP